MTLHVRESGPAGAPTIVFLHGGGGAGWMWQPQVEQLDTWHCLVPDLPEHGLSGQESPFTIEETAERIAELIRARAHGGRAHVVGLSLGAQVTVALLGIVPEVVDRAIVSSALVRPLPGSRLMTPRVLALTHRWLVRPFRHSAWWIRLNMKYAAGIPDRYYPQFSRSFRELTASGFANVMVANQRFRLPSGLGGIQVPTLIVVGRKERGVMHHSARDLAAAIPGATACEVIHEPAMSMAAEHNWNPTAPDLFTQTVRAWIAGEPLPSALRLLPR